MSTTPKPPIFTVADAQAYAEDARNGFYARVDHVSFLATVEALDASRAAFEQLQRDATSAAEKYLDAINDSEARAQAALALVRRLHSLAFREGSNPDLNGDPEADLRKAFGTQRARVKELEALMLDGTKMALRNGVLQARAEKAEAELAEVRRVLDRKYVSRHDFEKALEERESALAERNFARDDQEAAEKSLTEARASEARAQAAQARVVDLEARVGVLAAGLRDVEQANANCQTRIVALEREAKLLSDDDDACHRLLDQALGEGTSNDTSMETLLERLPRLVARAEKAEAEMAELREALANLEAACASVASWSEECLDYSDATRVAARKLLAKLEG